MQKIGIFGGTFAPFHKGHLTIAKCFIAKCSLNKCFIVPAKCSPFKLHKDKLYTDIERINIIKNEITTINSLELSEYEIDKNVEASYSIDTIRYFNTLYPNDILYLLIGYDVALDFDK